jgi:hypothetical protein
MIRKIDGSKWGKYDVSEGIDQVSADLITKDLKTKSNKLSLWFADSEALIDDVILALVSSCKIIESIDIIKIDKKLFEFKNLSFDQDEEDANTAYSKYKSNHYNLKDLTYGSLGDFTKLILENKSSIKRVKKQDIKSILKDGLDTKKIKREDLDRHMVESLKL